MKKAILFLFCIIALTSCDKIEGPYRETKVIPNDSIIDDSVRVRKVLVEDYTGHLCGNCPEAARKLDSIMHEIPGKVIPLAIHAGYFAGTPAGNYSYDFKVPESIELDNYFGISTAGNPNGMVNRSGHSNQTHIIPFTSWKDSVQIKLARPADASFDLSVNYASTTRSVTCTTKVEMLKDMSQTLKLCVYLTEDSIIQYQKDYSRPSGQQDISNYVHMHALRGSLNGTWGEAINSAPVTANQVITKSHSYTLPTAYVANHCNIVVFVYNSVTNEVIQADMKPLVP